MENETLFIFVPYIKTSILDKIIPKNKSKAVIITTWHTDDLLTNSSELKLYTYCKENQIALYINNKIHLKVFSIGLKSMIVSTGNISERGLMPEGNYECGVFVDKLSGKDRLFFEKIRKDARLVTDRLYQDLLEWYEKQSKKPPQNNEFDQIVSSLEHDDFLISALPMTKDIELLTAAYENISLGKIPSDDEEISSCVYHDLANYDIELGLSREQFLALLKKQFFAHSFIKKIDGFISPEAYFGAIKEWIQNNCTDVPIPSRRELTSNVQVLYEWFEKLGDGKYVMDRPSYSQRLRKIKS